jgi:hypothetical protein
MDCYAHSAIGFKVTEDDFIRETKATDLVCPKGHEWPGGGAKFCQECGGKFDYLTEVWGTKKLRVLAQLLDDEGFLDNDCDNFEDYWHVLVHEGDDRGVVEVGDTNYGGFLIIGEEVGNTGSHRGDAAIGALGVEGILKTIEWCKEVRKALGFEDRPITLYTWLYVSC